MTPVRNGVLAYLKQYSCIVVTDLYMIEGLMILRTSVPKIFSDTPAHVTVNRIEHWFDEHQNYGVLIVEPGAWVIENQAFIFGQETDNGSRQELLSR
jgi:hypothetical protein